MVEAVVDRGLLFLSDPKRPNAIQVLTGQFPRGSWWSHPRANDIYDILQSVEHHADLLLAKLLAGKVTLIHRALWPALLTVATAREPWQTEGLSAVGRQWLASFDEAQATGAAVPPVSRTVAKEMELRLLVFADSVHTPSGRHETRVDSWSAWAARAGQPWPLHPALPVAAARTTLETAAARLGPPPPRLPWFAAPAPADAD